MFPSPDEIMSFLAPYAYEPLMVYGLVTLLLTVSSFGLPIPEEVTLISAGVVAYIGLHPEQFPPPTPDASPVNPWVLSVVCFLAVFLSDYLVFTIGRYCRTHADKLTFFQRLMPAPVMVKVTEKTNKYGALMAGVFRFTPGVRFPGHFACGFLGVAPWKFVVVDGTAALVSVPTQVLLLSFYGEQILGMLKEFKMWLFIVLAVVFTIFVVKKIRHRQYLKKLYLQNGR